MFLLSQMIREPPIVKIYVHKLPIYRLSGLSSPKPSRFNQSLHLVVEPSYEALANLRASSLTSKQGVSTGALGLRL